jgi:hypothetical protein
MRFLALLFLLGCCSAAYAQKNYSTNAQITARLKDLANKNAELASLNSAGKSAGGKVLWLLTLSLGNP